MKNIRLKNKKRTIQVFGSQSRNRKEPMVDAKTIRTSHKPCATSIALEGQLFMHFIQLSHLKLQNGRALINLIACTGHCFIQR